MNGITFEWDENKNQINIKKHHVSFEEATGVFYDPHAILFDDPDHSAEEERYLIIGMSSVSNVCTVSHCYREYGDQDVIRIISARLATRTEQKYYIKSLEGELL